jgi:putative DNA primase/helicase
VDYEDYPHLTCDNIDAKRNQAEDIKERLLQAQTKQDLIEIREQYSNRCDWVWKNLLTKAQRRTLKEIAAVQQLDIFASQTASAEISESAAQCELSLEQLIEVLEVVDSPEDFATAIAGHAIDVVQDCICMSDSQPRRRLLESWLESLQSGE